MTVSRSNPAPARRIRAGGFASLALCVAVTAGLAACSAGQITQTADQVAAVPGANVDGGKDGTIKLRNVVIAYNDVKGYPQGGSAPLVVRIFNTGIQTVRLVGVSAGDLADGVRLVGGTPAPTATALPTTAPPASPDPSATGSATAGATSGATPGATTGGTPSATAGPSQPVTTPAPTATTRPQPAGQATFSIAIPPASYVLLVPGSGPYLQLTGLKRPLSAGEVVPMLFTFDDRSEIAVNVPFGQPAHAVPRGSAEHAEEEGH